MLRPAPVRRATEHDVPAVLELLRRYFAEGDVLQAESESSLLRHVRAPVPGLYVAEGAAGLIGCVLCHVLRNVPDAAECKRLYVQPESRGAGVAGRLMDAAEAAARAAGLGWMYLDSKDTFAVAMAMYRRRGYGECERFNDNPEATFFFRKRLL